MGIQSVYTSIQHVHGVSEWNGQLKIHKRTWLPLPVDKFWFKETSDNLLFSSGPEANKSCVFPFQYGNITYNGCVKERRWSWCSTGGDVYDDTNNWGWCSPDCALHEDIVIATIKMTLQYKNNLWAGLKLYGNLLSCFLLYSLILTALISAIGIVVTISHNYSHS